MSAAKKIPKVIDPEVLQNNHSARESWHAFEIMAEFVDATERLKQITPANALDRAGGPYGGDSTRLGLTTLAVWHASDHYGQIVVYLRMNGIVPPPSSNQVGR